MLRFPCQLNRARMGNSTHSVQDDSIPGQACDISAFGQHDEITGVGDRSSRGMGLLPAGGAVELRPSLRCADRVDCVRDKNVYRAGGIHDLPQLLSGTCVKSAWPDPCVFPFCSWTNLDCGARLVGFRWSELRRRFGEILSTVSGCPVGVTPRCYGNLVWLPDNRTVGSATPPDSTGQPRIPDCQLP